MLSAACDAAKQLFKTNLQKSAQKFKEKPKSWKIFITLIFLSIFIFLYFNSNIFDLLTPYFNLFNIKKLYQNLFTSLDELFSTQNGSSNHQITKFGIICLLVTIVSFPFTWGYVLINIATGYWCGILQGTCIMSISAVVGMSLSWYTVRRTFSKNNGNFSSSSIFRALSKLVGDEQKLADLIEPLADPKKAWSVLLMLRATPLPFGMINALFAMTKLPFSSFLFWSWIGLIPMQMVNCYIGSRLATISEVMHDKGGYMSAVLLLIQLLLSVFLIFCSIRIKKKKFEKLNKIDKAPDGSYYV